MQVTIAVKGQCIVYFKDRVWNVVFVTDKCHQVLFSTDPAVPNRVDKEILARKTVPRIITFSGGNAKEATGPAGTGALDELLNLSMQHLHEEDSIPAANGDRRSNLLVKPQSLNGRHYIHMKVPYGSLGATWPDDGDMPEYFVEEVGTGVPQTLGRSVASGIEITFDIDDASDLKMTIVDSQSGSDDRYYSGKADHTLTFNNDCEEPNPKVNDFLNIYDWVFDKPSGGTRKFVAGKLRKIGYEPKKSLTGDCDPVAIEPPPWP